MNNNEDKITEATPPSPNELTAFTKNDAEVLTPEQKAEKEAKYNEALEALKKLMRLRNRSGSRNVPGAFGGAHPGTKRKKKFARYIARNTVA